MSRVTRLFGGAVAVLGTLCFALPASAGAVQRYAEPGGDGPAPACSSDNPCSIQAALGASTSGDLVIALRGSYELGNTGLSVGQGVQLIGGGNDDEKATFVSSASPVIQLTQGSATTGLANVNIEHSGTGSALLVPRNTGADRVFAHTTGATACELGGGTISNSVCWNSAGTRAVLAISTEPVFSGASVGVAGALYNVTAIADAENSNGIVMQPGSPSTAAFEGVNTIARGGGTDVVRNSAGRLVMTNSNFETATGTAANCQQYTIDDILSGAEGFCTSQPGEQGGTNQTAAPQFVDGAQGDFHQVSSSPTVDQGNRELGVGSFDIDNQNRDQGLNVDIGADEFVPPDTDGDGLGDPLDTACPASPPGQDPDRDGCVNSEDADDDNDNVPDASDNCDVSDPQATGGDWDNDGCRDTEDPDDDGDGAADAGDQCVQSPLDGGPDPDGDGCRNSEDTDDDGDTVADATDNCPADANSNQLNTDGDNQGNACDSDDDGDGRNDGSDLCPVGAPTGTDTDADGCFNQEDADDDGDGISDGTDDCPIGAGSGPDPDGDGCVNGEDSDDDGDGVGDGVDQCVLLVGTASNNGCPKVTFTKTPKRKTTKRKANFEWLGEPEGLSFVCKLDSKPEEECGSSFSAKVSRGKHTFSVTPGDGAGNEGPPKTYRWTVKRR